jgi:hypothetical protein
LLLGCGESCVSTAGIRGVALLGDNCVCLFVRTLGENFFLFGRGLEARPMRQGKKKEVFKYADDMEFV